MLEEIYKETQERMKKSVDAVAREFNAVRTGKATVQLLDTVKVAAYGSQLPLNQVATIAAPEPRLLVVQAFEKGTVGEIVKGIQKADLGFNPIVEGQVIRIPVPPLNEERRQELARHCRIVAEEGRVAIRNIRRDANDRIKKVQKDKEISEDQEKDGLNEVQRITDELTSEIDDILEKKEKDVLEV
ncbi:MAG: ribosome recycling factor [candidate division Zixibacteria bacterium]|nr:ribosome recycling factor [candidate division Zixibacteria bacterium]